MRVENRFNVRTGAYLFNNNKELLLMKNTKGTWGIIGGHLEYGEEIEDGLLREIKEESGIDAEIISLFKIFSKKEDIIILFMAKTLNTDVVISHEHSDYKWVKVDELQKYDLTYDSIIDEAKILLEEIDY